MCGLEMARKPCKEKQISFGNNVKFSDFIASKYIYTREDKGDGEGILRTHSIPWVIRLKLFSRPQIPWGIGQQPIT